MYGCMYGWMDVSEEKTEYILHAMLSKFTTADICPSAGIEDVA